MRSLARVIRIAIFVIFLMTRLCCMAVFVISAFLGLWGMMLGFLILSEMLYYKTEAVANWAEKF
jgi:hypothetical protein